ncbi:uncharacterized protein B0I36DRAFT_362511 [Microdochium trichocladiopsis]|uniref:DUF7702 domain-containing protein n=1 Tax=Microdochium trichocladiopsis TaxID=1682393 RepID=A0A9P8Y807_9PEZI|nr:uncharacterized protein B0I36DRAFT_362511 [Microdochium trichocladiopsis]KAH7030681.1 hypothetical protein B0I36DRAFT_362511 [Microdochium trichocladiopsis]
MAPTETDIAIVQLVFFTPVVPLSIWLWCRYGFRLGAGAWRLVLVLGLLRLIAGSCALAAEYHPSESLYAAVLSCDLVGTAPLLLLSMRLVERVNDTYHKLPARLFRLVDLASLVGLVVGIIGANQALTSLGSGKPFTVNGPMIGAMVLFIVVLAADLISTAILFIPAVKGEPPVVNSAEKHELGAHGKLDSARSASSASPALNRTRGDIESNNDDDTTFRRAGQQIEVAAARKLIIAVSLMAPFLVVRLLFAAIGDFRNDLNFIPYLGDHSIYLGMSVLMEIVAAYICLGVGFACPPPPPPPAKTKASWWSKLRG